MILFKNCRVGNEIPNEFPEVFEHDKEKVRKIKLFINELYKGSFLLPKSSVKFVLK